MVTGLPAWLRLWAVLRQNHLRCWTYPEDVGRKMPVQTRTLTKVLYSKQYQCMEEPLVDVSTWVCVKEGEGRKREGVGGRE